MSKINAPQIANVWRHAHIVHLSACLWVHPSVSLSICLCLSVDVDPRDEVLSELAASMYANTSLHNYIRACIPTVRVLVFAVAAFRLLVRGGARSGPSRKKTHSHPETLH